MSKGQSKWQRNYVAIKTGERVRYSLITRPTSPNYMARFKGPDGRWNEKSTGTDRKPDAIGEAHRIIQETYGQLAPTSETATWDIAAQKLTAHLNAKKIRPATVKGYLETLRRVRAVFPLCKGPADITNRHAHDFTQKYGQGTFTRKKVKEGETAPAYTRKGKSLDSRLRTLKAVFTHFRTMSPPLVEANPFEGIAPPKLDRDVKHVTKTDVGDVFKWFQGRFPGWKFPLLFFRVKALVACRLDDLCSLPSSAVRDGGILFPGDVKKNRKGHFASLPADVFAELDTYKGAKFVWEKYPPELIEMNRKQGFPTHRQNAEFDSRRLYLWVVQIMQRYQKETGRDFSSHDFRKAAFTRAAEKDIHVKKAATAFDVTPETMLRYYTAIDQRKAAEELRDELAGDLDPTV